MRTPSARHKRRSIRSGYAFAHQEGFGRLITSGKMSVYRHNHRENVTENSNHIVRAKDEVHEIVNQTNEEI